MEANEHALITMLTFLANAMKWHLIILCAIATPIVTVFLLPMGSE